MHEQSVLRPTAENVLVVFTDSGDNCSLDLAPTAIRACDLSDIGLFPVVPTEVGSTQTNWRNSPPNMYELVRNSKTSLNGVGMKVMAVSLGTLNERISCQNFFINYPRRSSGLGPSYIIPSPVPNTSNLYYFDGGAFDTAEFVADQIRLGLAAEIISSPVCPNGCIGRPGLDGLGYCYCNENYLATQCTVEIVNCETNEVVSVEPSAKNYIGFVVKLRQKAASDDEPFFYDGGTGCWLVQESGVRDPNFFNIRINSQQLYGDCIDCISPPWYRLTDCLDRSFIIYTRDNLSPILARNNTIITHQNYPDRCLFIENIGPDGTYDAVPILGNIILEDAGCEQCPRQSAVNFILTDCANSSNRIYCDGLTNDLQPYISQVVNIQGFGTQCWLVEINPSPPISNQDVIVTASFPDCVGCLPVTTYAFTNCQDPTVVVYTRQDFSQYVGEIIRLQEYQGVCWVVSQTNIVPPSISTLTIDGPSFIDCPSCIVTYYQLTNCANPDVFLISTSTELSRYVGRTITAAGYTGLCFTVTPPQCDCIRATINGVEYDAYVESAQFNGRNTYYITTDSGDELAIAWSINPNQWELFDRNTSATLGFHTTENDCPFSNFWTIVQGSPYIITTVSFCADRIYNIAPELDFADCEPCINCI
jgi:hypothetical protein